MSARGDLVGLSVLAFACGTPPPPREAPPPESTTAVVREVDDCAPTDGKPVEPLVRKYEGVAAAARCQREVYTIMGFVTRAMGQPCQYCHDMNDFTVMTHRKHVANWMAQKLIPTLEKRGGGDVWCKDCHAASGTGRAKILGEPRSKSWAIEWMSTHLVERFDTADGHPLRCKMCHVGNVGSKEWDPKVILGEHLPPIPKNEALISGTSDAGAAPPGDVDAGMPPGADAGVTDGG
jgi:hypothetical protein